MKSFRRDFGIPFEAVEGFKAALTLEQVHEFNLAPSMEAKDSSPTYQMFVDTYGITDAYELEAFEPSQLAEVLENAICSVMDTEAFEAEQKAEKADAAKVLAVKQRTKEFFKGLQL
jgi:hypothetical protein